MSRIGAAGPISFVRSLASRANDPAAPGRRHASIDAPADEGDSQHGANMQAQIADTQEDMSDVMAQFARRLRRPGGTRRSEDAERILDSDVDEKLEELGQLIEFSHPDAHDLLGDARRRFGDASDLMLALRELRRRRRLEGEPVDLLDEAIEEHTRQTDPKLMKAGINAALKAKVFGKRMQLEPARLRQLYRQFLLFEGTYLMIYESWIEEYGLKRRRRILEFVQAALTYDMHSLDPSSNGAEEFGPLLNLIGRVRTLNGADEQFTGRLLTSKVLTNSTETEALGVTMLLSALLAPENVGVTLKQLLEPYLIPLGASEQSQLIQCVLRAAATIPVAIFEEVEDRHLLIDTIKNMAEAPFEAERRIRRMRGR
jgi:type III secretion protein W